MSGEKPFIDSNVFIYASDESPEESVKHALATDILRRLDDNVVVSTQVLQEFYVATTRKLRVPLSEQRATEAVQGLCKLNVVRSDSALVLSAIDTSRSARISLWDALIIEAARRAGCTRVLTEDLSHGQKIHGVTVEDPFRT